LSSRAADSRWRVQRGNDPALCTGKKRLGAPFKPCFGLSGIPLAQTDRSHCVIPTVAYPDFLLCVTNDVYVCGSLKRNKARFTPPAGRRRRWRLRRNKFSLHVWEGRKGHESPGAPSFAKCAKDGAPGWWYLLPNSVSCSVRRQRRWPTLRKAARSLPTPPTSTGNSGGGGICSAPLPHAKPNTGHESKSICHKECVR
jgi:hypothetical protein